MKKNNTYQFFMTKGLLIIILLAFVIRVVFFVSLQPWDNVVTNNIVSVGDARGYHQLALSLLDNKSFENFGAFRTPGYPVFVAMIYSITWRSVWFVLLVQILLNVVSVVIIFRIAQSIFSRTVALFAALFFAIDIHQALYSVALLTDSIFVFLFLSSVYYLCKSIKDNNLSVLCLSALLLGLATLVRPISFLFPLVAIFFILFLRKIKLERKLVFSLLFCIVFIATISPWLLHNYSKHGEAKLSSISGFNLLFWNVAYTEVYKTGNSVEKVRIHFHDLAKKQGADTTEIRSFKNAQIYSDIAKKYIKNNFILYCKRHFMGIINMYIQFDTNTLAPIFHLKPKPLSIDSFGGPGVFPQIIDFFKSKTTGEILIGLSLIPYLLINYIFSLYGILLLIRKKEYFVVLFILIILYFSAITGVVGLVRYKLPFMPIINILCAVGLINFYTKITGELSCIKKIK